MEEVSILPEENVKNIKNSIESLEAKYKELDESEDWSQEDVDYIKNFLKN